MPSKNSKKKNIKIKSNWMSAIFLFSAGKANHMKPSNIIDLIKVSSIGGIPEIIGKAHPDIWTRVQPQVKWSKDYNKWNKK